MDTLAERLKEQLDAIVVAVDELIEASAIDFDPYRGERVPFVFTVSPSGMWEPTDDTQRQLQRRVIELWEPWWEQVELTFSGDPPESRNALHEASTAVDLWINRSGNDFSIPATIQEAKGVFQNHVVPFYKTLRSLGTNTGEVVAVPDSNVLIRNADITSYGFVLGADAYTVLLVPGVLGEMDDHKVNHRNPAVREKARKFSKRMKGWRTQGRLADGVKVQGDIYVQVEGKEPNFEKTLSWLDPTVVDDRIVASILEVQRRFPTARVVLLTGDSLMLAKADAASIPTADTPDPEP